MKEDAKAEIKEKKKRERRSHLWPCTIWSCNELFRVFQKGGGGGGGRGGNQMQPPTFGKQPDIPVFKFQPLADTFGNI